LADDRDDFSTTKYIIRASIEVEGVVEKPDVVGAIFGQTEGLLGGELDLRELQKTGRIGRIVVNIDIKGGKSSGTIIIPSSLDRIETAILAAAIETIDRVGPCKAHLKLEKIEDVREVKRERIIKRAVEILKKWVDEVTPESQEITEVVMNEVRTSSVIKHGPENLPAGPAVADSDSIIIVEGRADVVNLLKYGFKNVIAVEGTSIPRTIIELSHQKTTTAFLDGDRGGDLILRELLEVADIDYVARAPPGKEVEELTRKEIIKCLRNKIPVEQLISHEKTREDRERKHVEKEEVREKEKYRAEHKRPVREKIEIPEQLTELVTQVKDKLKSIAIDENFQTLTETTVGELADQIKHLDHVYAIAFDGVITQRLVDIAFEKGAKYLIGARIGKIQKKPVNLHLITFDAVSASE